MKARDSGVSAAKRAPNPKGKYIILCLAVLLCAGCAQSRMTANIAKETLSGVPAIYEKDGVAHIHAGRAAIAAKGFAVNITGAAADPAREKERALALRNGAFAAKGIEDARAVLLYGEGKRKAALRFCEENAYHRDGGTPPPATAQKASASAAGAEALYTEAAEQEALARYRKLNRNKICYPAEADGAAPIALRLSANLLPDIRPFAANEPDVAAKALSAALRYYPRVKTMSGFVSEPEKKQEGKSKSEYRDDLVSALRLSAAAGLYRFCGGAWSDAPLKKTAAVAKGDGEAFFLRYFTFFNALLYESVYKETFVSCGFS